MGSQLAIAISAFAVNYDSSMLKPQFDAVKNLIKAMVDISKCIVEFRELPSHYISPDVEALSTAFGIYQLLCTGPLEAFWLAHVSTTEAWELSSLAHKLSNMHNHLKTQLAFAISTLVNLEVLRRKNVLLLISDLDISQEELSILEQIYNEARQQHGTGMRTSMPWYTVHHPSLIDRAVIKFTKEVWHFQKKPILVVLDPHGRVVCPNALHMMWIWGSMAFPFTTAKEEALWREETWELNCWLTALIQ
ncbi:hypothetical protein JRO89_XS01G0230300 [Xanthoceras sorbifolium]|uniref:Sieve element occlusion N-terminal domain-containing protein n=1 Tax=Xanthoceras sorbifolium TaxID=99658 RepID=A0ABQ8IMC0_9ROSI|nr:hypothetical protein JRO89_XS01G0230300 [Xanthoceras sorbifolium]